MFSFFQSSAFRILLQIAFLKKGGKLALSFSQDPPAAAAAGVVAAAVVGVIH